MKNTPPTTDEKPPIMGAWNRLYVLVLVIHALLITVLYYFSIAYQ